MRSGNGGRGRDAVLHHMRIVTRMSVSFTGPESAFLHAEAERLGISVADAVRRIIDQHREGRPEKEIAVTSKRHAKAETVENLAAAPARTAQEEPDAAPVQHAPELVEPHQRSARPSTTPFRRPRRTSLSRSRRSR